MRSIRVAFLVIMVIVTVSLGVRVASAGGSVPRIGILWQGAPTAEITVRVADAFIRGLREGGGYVERQP